MDAAGLKAEPRPCLNSPRAGVAPSRQGSGGQRTMICVILVAGHGTGLENEIKRDTSGLFAHLEGVPKALLPGVGGKKILDFWWEALRTRQLFSEVYMVTNADKFKHFERWATANEFPVKNIVNDGSSTEGTRLGAVADFHLAVRTKAIDGHVLVVAGDMLCGDQNFDIVQVLKFFRLKDGELAIYYEMEESEITSSRGILEVCPTTHRLQRFFEKPAPGVTGSRLASVVFYCFRKTTLSTFAEFLSHQSRPSECGFGKYMEWLVNESGIPVYGMKLPGGFHLIGQVGLSDYHKWLSYYSERHSTVKHQPITCRAYARVGIMGNPSDGFYGKTIAMTIANFWADTTITESKTLVLLPHPLNDPTEFGSLHDLHGISRKEGSVFAFAPTSGCSVEQRNSPQIRKPRSYAIICELLVKNVDVHVDMNISGNILHQGEGMAF